MKERISVTPKIIELNDTNDIYMTMNLRILSSEKNLNNAVFLSSFINGIVSDKEKYIGLPFLVNKEALENDEYLTHELDTETGELKTDQIGSFVDYWVDKEDDDKEVLMGSIRVFKRFPTVCEKIIELYENDSLSTSCEVLIKEYEEISEDGERYIGYSDGKNVLIGSAIVTDPAMVDAKPTLLIAEAYQKDIELEQKGVDNVTKNKEYNNGIKVEYCGELEMSSLKFHEIEQQVYNIVNPVETKTGYREYNYYIHTLYHDKVILESETGYKLYSAGYKIENDTVVIDKEDDWKKGSFQFVPDGVSVNELMEQNTSKITELEKELNELKEEKETMSKKNEVTVEELNEKIEGLEKEVSKLKEENEKLEATIVSQKEEAIKSEEKVNELNETIKELNTYKDQVKKAEKEAKQKELNERFSKVLDEETFKSEEVVNAIENLDEAKLNSIVVAQLAKKAEIETNSKEEVVEISAVRSEDLIETTKDSSYWSAPKGD